MMTTGFPRRNFLQLAAGVIASPAVSGIAGAQAYPSRPVRIVIGFAAGGGQDMTGRLIGQWLSERLGQQFVVENRPGAGTNIAAEAVVRAPPDGYTLLLASSPSAINATLYDKLNYNFLKDIAPVAAIVRETSVLVVHPSLPVHTVPQFIAYAKANPGKISMASSGVGAMAHMSGELFKMMTGIDMIHVPYRGTGPALTDLLAGQVQAMFSSVSGAMEYVKANKLRALAITTVARSESLPNLPTIGEFVPGYEANGWNGIGAPKDTPVAIIDKLNREINEILVDPRMKARLTDLGSTVLPGSPADFGKLVADETEKWGKVIRTGKIKAE